ncbi:MAG: ATP-binding protein [Acidobacteriota bacterium]|nr:ATP-binding protein [Acidobacteriota bacterium]
MKPSKEVQRYFSLFDTLVMHVSPDLQTFNANPSHAPLWFTEREWEGFEINREVLTEAYPFLECFWPEADFFWGQTDKQLLRSGIWEEPLENGSVPLEAIAMNLEGAPLMFIGPLMFDYEAKAKMLQQARDLLLAHETLERKEAELRRKRQQQKDLLLAIPDTYLVVDHEGKIIEHNTDLLPPASGIGYPLGSFFSEDNLDEVEVNLSLARDSKQNRELELTQRSGGSERSLELRLVHLDSGHILCIIRDVTQQRQIAQMKDSFLAMAGHELRSPLTGISGCLTYVLEEVKDLPTEVNQWLSMALESSDRLLRMVAKLLHVQKIESGHQIFNKMHMEVGSFMNALELSFKGLTVSTGIPVKILERGSGLHIWADSDALRQVLENLVSNAVKHSPEDKAVEISACLEDNRVRFSVTDFGSGIPQRFRETIFQKFTQVPGDRAGKKGTGLGLSIAKAIVEEHKGSIGVDSEEGKYTTFYVQFPLFQAPGR